jgi:hypothetical protein
MLKIAPSPTFVHTIIIQHPAEDDAPVNFVFRSLKKDGLIEFIGRARADADAAAHEIVAGWDGVEVEFSTENLAVLLKNYPSAAKLICDGYLDANTGAAAKN